MPAVSLVDWMNESIVVMVRNAWRASVWGLKLEIVAAAFKLDSESLDFLNPSWLVFRLLELAMGVE
jgi:hypothetical protein